MLPVLEALAELLPCFFTNNKLCELCMVAFDSPQTCHDHQSTTTRSSTNLAKKSRQLQSTKPMKKSAVIKDDRGVMDLTKDPIGLLYMKNT